MHLAPAKDLVFTDLLTGVVIFSAPTPCLAQIEACIRLEPTAPADPAGGVAEASITRQRRMLAQCLALLCPPVLDLHSPLAWLRAWRHRRRATRFLRTLQYPQILDCYTKLMLAVQGIDFETVEQFERALAAQKKSTGDEPSSPPTKSSPDSTS